MTPVRQDEPDQCVRACLASILELPLDAVPRFDPQRWFTELRAWLKTFGWDAVLAFMPDDSDSDSEIVPAALTLGGIESSAREGWEHCVVLREGRIVWDPLSGAARDKPVTTFTVLFPLDPAPAFRTAFTR